MSLTMPTAWRYGAPGALPAPAASEFNSLVHTIAKQTNESWGILELFKTKFGSSSTSSSESWAVSDLYTAMMAAAENAPLFISSFWEGCEQVRSNHPEIGLPDVNIVNGILHKHAVLYELRPPALLPRASQTPIPVVASEQTIGGKAYDLIHASLAEADRLLGEQRPRQAVQEILWLLETVSTAFQGQESGTGTIEGKYFNRIVLDLRNNHRGTALAEALSWMSKMHGFLSSPGGGGVRHGTRLADNVSPTLKEAHLYCNLTRSFINYLLAELPSER